MVVELVPFFSLGVVALFDERVVVAGVCSSSVDHDTLQLELIVITGMLEGLRFKIFRDFFSFVDSILLSLSSFFFA